MIESSLWSTSLPDVKRPRPSSLAAPQRWTAELTLLEPLAPKSGGAGVGCVCEDPTGASRLRGPSFGCSSRACLGTNIGSVTRRPVGPPDANTPPPSPVSEPFPATLTFANGSAVARVTSTVPDRSGRAAGARRPRLPADALSAGRGAVARSLRACVSRRRMLRGSRRRRRQSRAAARS